jgi:predicted DNA-binding WGR domain protein
VRVDERGTSSLAANARGVGDDLQAKNAIYCVTRSGPELERAVDRASATLSLPVRIAIGYDSCMLIQERYFERVDQAERMARYYRLSIARTLFGEWALIREWGRIGRRGQAREHWFASLEDAQGMLARQALIRLRRGYRAA